MQTQPSHTTRKRRRPVHISPLTHAVLCLSALGSYRCQSAPSGLTTRTCAVRGGQLWPKAKAPKGRRPAGPPGGLRHGDEEDVMDRGQGRPNPGGPARPRPLPGQQTRGFADAPSLDPYDEMQGYSRGVRTQSAQTRGLPAVGLDGQATVSYLLVIACMAVFLIGHIPGLDMSKYSLELHHRQPKWYQLITALFCHEGWTHLFRNMFNLHVFGKLVEEDMGKRGLLVSFFVCGVVSNLISLLVMPRNSLGFGASGAIFGLYAVSVLGKVLPRKGLSWRDQLNWRNFVDVVVFGEFVASSLIFELQMVDQGGSGTTNHTAHFAGVVAGALLVTMARRLLSSGVSAPAPPGPRPGAYTPLARGYAGPESLREGRR